MQMAREDAPFLPFIRPLIAEAARCVKAGCGGRLNAG
jgi:hypothetical protein